MKKIKKLLKKLSGNISEKSKQKFVKIQRSVIQQEIDVLSKQLDYFQDIEKDLRKENKAEELQEVKKAIKEIEEKIHKRKEELKELTL